MSSFIKIHLLISGKVQNVGYRQFCKAIAKRLNISGWVRNLSNKKVEIVAIGRKDQLTDFLEKLKKGPMLSRVNKIKIVKKEQINKGDFNGEFKKLATR